MSDSLCNLLNPFSIFLYLVFFVGFSFLLIPSAGTVIFLCFTYSHPWIWTFIPVSLRRFRVECFDVSHVPKSPIRFPQIPLRETVLESKYEVIINVSVVAGCSTGHKTLFIILLRGDCSLIFCCLGPYQWSVCLWSSSSLGSRARLIVEARLMDFEDISGFIVSSLCIFPKPHNVAEIIIITSRSW